MRFFQDHSSLAGFIRRRNGGVPSSSPAASRGLAGRVLCLACIALLAGALGACGSDNGGRSAGRERPGAAPAAGSSAITFEHAIEVRQKSGCNKAIPLFKQLAGLGRGYEVAQLQLGECYLQAAGHTSDPDRVKQLRSDAAEWIVKAANANLPEAQQRASWLYLEGTGLAEDLVQAGKWFLLLQHNPLRPVLGPATIDSDLNIQLHQRLSQDDWQQAEALADRWQPTDRNAGQPSAAGGRRLN